jgi:hypothetical protein
MKALITRTKNDTFYVYLTEKMLSKQDCLTIGKYTNSHKKRILPVFEYGCFLDDDYEYPIAVVERSTKNASFDMARRCKAIIEAVP